MKCIFSCTQNGRTFETDDFSVTDNRSMVTESDGQKILKATVLLNTPCPFCGERHEYRAEDLACPFDIT